MPIEEVISRVRGGEVYAFTHATWSRDHYSVGDLRDHGLTKRIRYKVNNQGLCIEQEQVMEPITIVVDGEELTEGMRTDECEVDLS
jgi:hypothetical protein